MRILLTGGTGFIGSAISKRLLDEGHSIVLLTRQIPSKKKKGIQYYQFDYLTDDFHIRMFDGVDGVIHLAGEDLSSSRWSKAKKESIRSSRIDYSEKIVSFINKNCRLKFFLSASAIGYYVQSKNDQMLDESSANGTDFLAGICSDWEREISKIKVADRVLVTRFGIVLGKDGGALKKALPVFQAGTGGRLGDGKQWMSWIHIEDLVNALIFIVSSNEQGVFNLTSPNPVRNTDFTEALAHALHRPSFVPVPETVLKLMAGEMATLLLSSQRVLPKHLESLGFKFQHPELRKGLENLLKV